MPFDVFSPGDLLSSRKLNDRLYTTIIKQSTQRITGTVRVNDTDLYASLDTNSVYEIRAVILNSGSASADINVSWRGAVTGMRLGLGRGESANNAGVIAPDSWSSTVRYRVGSRAPIFEHGYVVVGSQPTTFQLSWAQWFSNATPTTVYQNSYLSYRKIA